MGRELDDDEYPDGINELPRDVSFSYSDHTRRGQVVDEVRWLQEGTEGTYMHFLQLIRYEDDDEHIRGGYYLRKKGEDTWTFMSRNTFHVRRSVASKMIKSAVEKGML